MVTLNLQALRANKHMSQQDLADKLGVSKTYISDIERGVTKPKNNLMLYSLAYIFGVNSDLIKL